MSKPCTICELADVRQLYVSSGISVVQCNRCGLVYCDQEGTSGGGTIPDGEDEGIGEQYFYEIYESMHGYWTGYFNGLLQQIEAFQPPARLLDVGCGLGYLVEAAQNRGWEATGLEISQDQAAYARQRLNLAVFSSTLEDADLPEDSFDVVTLHSVIEHVQNPRRLLDHVARVLRPGGLVMVETPNQDSLVSLITAFTYRLTFGRILLPIYGEEHIYRFSARTVEALLRKAGFGVLQIEPHEDLVISARRVLFRRRWRRFWYAGMWTTYQAAQNLGLQNHLLVFARRAREV